MKKRRLKTWRLIIFIVFILLVSCILIILNSLKDRKKLSTKVIDKIESYNYTLTENETSYYKDLFKSLKTLLSKDTKDEKEYVTIISKMFLIDFYDLASSINKNDIGGVDFVYEGYKESFTKKAKDTVYKYVENNIYNDRKQKLPSVKDVKVNEIKNDSHKKDKNAFYVKCEVIYTKDLGYPKEVNLVLIHSNNKIEIVSME